MMLVELSAMIMLVDLFVAIMQVTVSVTVIQLEVTAAFMQVKVSAANIWVITFTEIIAITQVVFSTVNYAHDNFYYADDCFCCSYVCDLFK